MASVDKRFKDIVAGIFKKDAGRLKGSTRFVEDLNAKSIDFIALVAATENEFKIKIPGSEARKNKTIKQSIDYIKKKIKGKK